MNVEFFLVFLLAHFLGDFVFQTNKIAKMKSEDIKGVFCHSMIVFIFQTALLSMFGMKGIVAGILGAMTHFLIDYAKLLLGKYLIRLSFFYFLIDQTLHIAVIVILDYLLKPDMAINGNIVLSAKYLIFLIVFTYITTVMSKMMLQDLFENIRNSPFFMEKERIIDGAFSLVSFICIVNFNLLIAKLILLVICILFITIQKKRYSYDYYCIAIKLGFYLTAGYVGGLLIVSLLKLHFCN